MKKILTILVAFVLIISLGACTGKDSTGKIATRIKTNTGKLLNTLNQLDTLNTSDVLIDELSPSNMITSYGQGNYQTLNKRFGVIENNTQNSQTYPNNINSRRGDYNTYPAIYDGNTLSARRSAAVQDLNPNYNNYPNINNNATNYYRTRGINYSGQNTNNAGYYNGFNNNPYPSTINQSNPYNNAEPSGAYTYVPRQDYQNSPTYMSRFNLYGQASSSDYSSGTQSAYNLAGQVFYANSLLFDCKNQLKLECEKLSVMANNLKEGNLKLNSDQKKALNTHINEIKAATKRLNSTKGDVAKEVGNIKPLRVNFSNNMDTLNARYTKILNALLSRLNDCQMALDSARFCNGILLNKQENLSSTINQTSYRYPLNTQTQNNNTNQNETINNNYQVSRGTSTNGNYVTTIDRDGNSVTVYRDMLINTLNNNTSGPLNYITIRDVNNNVVRIDKSHINHLRVNSTSTITTSLAPDNTPQENNSNSPNTQKETNTQIKNPTLEKAMPEASQQTA